VSTLASIDTVRCRWGSNQLHIVEAAEGPLRLLGKLPEFKIGLTFGRNSATHLSAFAHLADAIHKGLFADRYHRALGRPLPVGSGTVDPIGSASKPLVMSPDSPQALVDLVARALTAAGYVSEPDPTNNTGNAPAYLKVFSRDIPKHKRVDYLNLVFSGPNCERVVIEGEETHYGIPANLAALVGRVQNNLPRSAP
jgi:hypothetical protein